jgi:salicylate hydroxylase
VLTYPISGGRECNIVTAFIDSSRPRVTKMEDIPIERFRSYYADLPEVVQRVIGLIEHTKSWPLLTMPRMPSWSNSCKNVVLLGDAAHAMQNHMAQGAATAMEDGAFLGRIISEVVRGVISVPEAVQLYEQRRMPKAWLKQQLSFVSGMVNMTDDPAFAVERDRASLPEVMTNGAKLPPTYRSWQLFAQHHETIPHVFYYDAEWDADSAVCEYLLTRGVVDEETMVSVRIREKWLGFVGDNGVGGGEGWRNGVANGRGNGKGEGEVIGISREDHERYGKGL